MAPFTPWRRQCTLVLWSWIHFPANIEVVMPWHIRSWFLSPAQPFINKTTISSGGFLLLIALSLDREGVLFKHCEIFGNPSIWFFLEVLVGCEFTVTLVSLAFYIGKIIELSQACTTRSWNNAFSFAGRVYRFNNTQPVPDIFNVTNISSMPVIFNSRSVAEIGPG